MSSRRNEHLKRFVDGVIINNIAFFDGGQKSAAD